MDQLTAMRLFVRVVQTGSFTAVARESGVSQASVSKGLAALEAKLGTRLLNRTSRKISLTEVGTDYYERCLPILLEVDEAESAVSRRRDKAHKRAGRTDLDPHVDLDDDETDDASYRRRRGSKRKARQSQPIEDEYDADEDESPGTRKLSKSERKRLRKLKARQRQMGLG